MDQRTKRAKDGIERMRGLAGVRSYPGKATQDAISRIRRIGDEQQRKANGQFGSGGGGSSSSSSGSSSGGQYERAHRNPQSKEGAGPLSSETKSAVFGSHGSNVTKTTNPSTGEVGHEATISGGTHAEVQSKMRKMQNQWKKEGFQRTTVEGMPAYKGPKGTIVHSTGGYRRDPQTGAESHSGKIQFYPA
ncbi:hypothetical protein JXVLWARM_CDS_0008 [Burkholderia phage Bm1]